MQALNEFNEQLVERGEEQEGNEMESISIYACHRGRLRGRRGEAGDTDAYDPDRAGLFESQRGREIEIERKRKRKSCISLM